MYVGTQIKPRDDQDYRMWAQLGVTHVCVDPPGNPHDWSLDDLVRTREHDNDWPYLLVGCYWSGCYGGGKPTCHSTNDAHGPEFRFYETGFRCCRDAKAK